MPGFVRSLAVWSVWMSNVDASLGANLGAVNANKTEQFTEARCQAVVAKVQKSGKYTEESIVPICEEEMESPKCDFFAEALSLASSRTDFNSSQFCENMDEARFCSEIMDKLLASLPVSDLAFGECERAKPPRDDPYCAKFKLMLAYAVKNEDLDTMRACYMIEAYTTMANSSDLEPSEESPKSRIIAAGGNDLQGVGFGNATAHNRVGASSIVLQPQPFESFGNGTSSQSIAASPAAKQSGGIITEPIPAAAAILQRGAKVNLAASRSAPASSPPATAQGGLARSVAASTRKQAAAAPHDAAARPNFAVSKNSSGTGAPRLLSVAHHFANASSPSNATSAAGRGSEVAPTNATAPARGDERVTPMTHPDASKASPKASQARAVGNKSATGLVVLRRKVTNEKEYHGFLSNFVPE